MKRMSSSLSLKIKTWITQLRLLNYWHTMPLEHELRVAKNLFTIRMVLNQRQWTKYMHNQGFWHGQMKRAARYFCRRLWQPFLELRRKLWTIGWAIKIIFENVTYSKGTGETQRLICLIRVQDCNSFEHMVSSLAFPAIFTILRLSRSHARYILLKDTFKVVFHPLLDSIKRLKTMQVVRLDLI